MKRKDKRKKKLIIICSLVVVFLLYNIYWYFLIYRPYIPFCEAVGKDEDGDYYCIKDDISFYVKKPDYLKNNGNLAISNAVIREGEDVLSMIIWRNIDGSYTLGIASDEYEVEDDGTVTQRSIKFEMNENFELLKTNDQVEKVFEEKRVDIEEYCNLAYGKWGILGD